MRSHALKLGAEPFDQISDEVRQLHEKWERRFVLSRSHILNGYRNGQFGLHLHARTDQNLFRVGGMRTMPHELMAKEFCAVLNYDGAKWRPKHPCLRKERVFRGNLASGGEQSGHEQQPVLIGVIHFGEDGQRIEVGGGSSMDRLQSIDACSSGAAEGRALSCYLSIKSGIILLPLIKDGELRFGAGLHSSINKKRVNQMVQSGSQLMNGLTNDNAELGRRRGVSIEIEDDLLGVLVEVLADSKNLIVAVSNRASLQITDVLMGPLNLR